MKLGLAEHDLAGLGWSITASRCRLWGGVINNFKPAAGAIAERVMEAHLEHALGRGGGERAIDRAAPRPDPRL